MKTIIASPHAPKAVGPYSQAVEAGGALYVSGQLPIDAASGKMDEGIEAQTRRSLTNLGHILREAGYAEFFTSEMPARMCYQVAALPMGALVEIDAVAVK